MDSYKLNALKQNLQDYAEHHLTKSKNNMFCCPVPTCKSGTKDKKTGALGIFEKDGTPLFKCHSCGASGSLVDLIMINEGLDLPSAMKRMQELYDPGYNPNDTGRTVITPQAPIKPQIPVTTPKKEAEQPSTRDFRNYYKMWNRAIKDTDYPGRRGLDADTVRRFNLGFASDWVNEKGEKNVNDKRAKEGKPPIKLTPSPMMIIPVDASHYTARDTREDKDIPDWAKDYKKVKVGEDGPLFNVGAMNDPLCFFVVEGEIDAMSIEQAGGSCVAYRSASNAEKFCQELKKKDVTKTGTVIIVQDNDKAGKKASDQIEKFCKENGFLFIRKNVSGNHKDPNEYLVADPFTFENTVKDIVEDLRREKMQDYVAECSAETAIDSFMMRKGTEENTIPTKFGLLDKFLDGGLHPALYSLGAVSSIGKTTFALQIAEQIATDTYPNGTQTVIPGRDVLFFSLEQSRDDLISKSLSRRTFEKSMKAGKKEYLAKTNMNILRRETWPDWSHDEWDTFYACQEEFKRTTGKHLFIVEAMGDYGIEEITEDVERHIAFTGRKPIVIIDYLQIMKPYDERMADKQNVDRTTSALKRLSRDNNIPIIAISSFNRESYWQQVSMTSYKESGSVEYSSDCLLALSPAGIEEASTDAEKKKNRETILKTKVAKVRNIELHILKNRNGRITDKNHRLLFDYTAMFNHFKEVEASYLDAFDNGNPDVIKM